jgi:hypothetical protein
MSSVHAEFERFKQSLIDQGIEKGIGKSVLQVLEARGVPVTGEARLRILSCTDLETLQGWLVRALQVSSADELFFGLH